MKLVKKKGLPHVQETPADTAEDRRYETLHLKHEVGPTCLCKSRKAETCWCYDKAFWQAHLKRRAIIYAPFPAIRRVEPRIWAGTIVGDTFYGNPEGSGYIAKRKHSGANDEGNLYDDRSDHGISPEDLQAFL